jgi:hypothetical protein
MSDQPQKLDDARTRNSRIERHNARFWHIGTFDVPIRYLTGAIGSGQGFDTNSVGIDMPPTGEAPTFRTNNDDASRARGDATVRAYAKCAAQIDHRNGSLV